MARSRTLLSLTAFALAAGPLAAQRATPPAQPPQAGEQAPMPRHGMPGMGGMGQMDPAMMGIEAFAPSALIDQRESLGLSGDQLSKLQALADTAKAAGDRAGAEHNTHQQELMQQFDKPAPDPAQVMQHAQAAMQAMTAGHVAMLVAAAKAKAILTPEQRGRVQGRVDAMRGMMMQRMGRMGHPGRMGRGARGGRMGPMGGMSGRGMQPPAGNQAGPGHEDQ